MPPLPPHPDVTILADDTVWSGRFPLQRIRFQHRRFDGRLSGQRTWELWRRGRAAAALPYDPARDEVALIEQFRLPALAAGLSPVITEIPAGLIDGADDPEATIRRELTEEAGLTALRTERVAGILLTPGGCDEHCTLFVSEVRLPPGPPDRILGTGGLAAEHEDIRVRALPATLAIERALAGAYENSVLLIALLWLASQRALLRARWLAA